MKSPFALLLLVGMGLLIACGQRSPPTATPVPTLLPVSTATVSPTTVPPMRATAPPTVGAPPTIGRTATRAPEPGATATPATAGTAAAQLAATGQVVYQQQCQVCHGEKGEGIVGPALIGSRASPAKYGPTAADWFAFMSTNMPRTTPGSLTKEEYVAVTTYLLLRNGLVSPTTKVDERSLRDIKTEK